MNPEQMKLIATMPCRNEDWVLGLSARAVLMWCDELLIMDHASTDRTADICAELIEEYGPRVQVLHDDDPTWREMAHRNALLNLARQRGATHIAIVDADEVLTGNLIEGIRPAIAQLTDGRLLQIPWACLAPGACESPKLDGIGRYYSAGVWGTNWVTMAFSDMASFEWRASGAEQYDFHKRHPNGSRADVAVRRWEQGQAGLMHLQFSSRRRLKAKQALYKCTEAIRWPGRKPVHEVDAMYNRAVYESDPLTTATAPVPINWWELYESLLVHLKVDAEPWQEQAVRDAIAEHGRAKFAGLDLFGVA